MTVALAIRVSEGVVLAADSQLSLVAHGPRGPELRQVHHHDGKIIALRERPALAALCWGAGSIGGITFRTLVQHAAADLPEDADPGRAADHLLGHCKRQLADPALPEHNARPDFGLLVAGYGPDTLLPACSLLRAERGRVLPAQPLGERLFWAGDGCEAITRLVLGHGSETAKALEQAGCDHDERRRLLHAIEDRCLTQLVHPEMPLAAAEALARFLVDTAIRFAQAGSASATAGGAVHAVVLGPS